MQIDLVGSGRPSSGALHETHGPPSSAGVPPGGAPAGRLADPPPEPVSTGGGPLEGADVAPTRQFLYRDPETGLVYWLVDGRLIQGSFGYARPARSGGQRPSLSQSPQGDVE
ncbi:MAG: hypothetical protein R3E12_07145 [Candidatus Eisenbacteria bacterium]